MSVEAPGRALVTGASGFVGGHVVDSLLRGGFQVRCLVRSTSRVDHLPRERVDLVIGDATDPATLPDALREVDWVVHAAGITRAPHLSRYRVVNEEGTRNLVRAARDTGGVRRFLLVSSLAAAGPSAPGRPRRESDAPAPEAPYGQSKLAAERALASEAGAMPWTVVRPPAVYGPRDSEFLKLFHMVRRGLTVRVGGPAQEFSLVQAEDLAEGIFRALTAPVAVGKCYFIAHPRATHWDEVEEIVSAALGRPFRRLFVPRRLFPGLTRLVGLGYRVLGKVNPFPVDRVRDLLAPAWTCDPGLAAEELGFHAAHDVREGLLAAAAWYREAGWL